MDVILVWGIIALSRWWMVKHSVCVTRKLSFLVVGKNQIKNGMPYMIRNTNGKDAINFRANIT